MSRFVTLGLLAAVVGGGWAYQRGSLPPQVQRAVGEVVSRLPVGAPGNGNGAFGGRPSVPTASPSATGYNAPYASSPPFAGSASTIRIASFNIQTFGDAKARKPYVMRALAEIVRRYDIVAIQEIRTQDNYFIPNFLRQYVNTDSATRYDARVSPRLGRTVSTEQYAFLYNTATVNVHPSVVFVMGDGSDLLHREPYVAMFQCRAAPADRAFTFLLMNVHTDPDEAADEMDALYGAYRAVQRMPIGGLTEDDVLIVGDLNTNVAAPSAHRRDARARSLLPADLHGLAEIPGIYAAVRDRATNTRGSRLHDNVLYSTVTTSEATGRAGVFDFRAEYGLTEEQALEVSDHLPVWAEFSAYESDVLGSARRRPDRAVYR